MTKLLFFKKAKQIC